MFRPKIFTSFKQGYSGKNFLNDMTAGLTVGVLFIPLSVAFAIACGVSPEKGLYTAVIGGIVIALLGGSKVQIAGPTGALIVLIYTVIQQFDISGLIVTLLLAGVILIIMGVARLGAVIKFIPYSLVVGLMSGIAVIIFSYQIKDFFGLEVGNIPSGFIAKWEIYFTNFNTFKIYPFTIALGSMIITYSLPKFNYKIPASLIAILFSTFIVYYFKLPVETIQSRFGNISSQLPRIYLPSIFNLEMIKIIFLPAFTIAFIIAIESIFSAEVADSMIGDDHHSDLELIALGIGNIISSVIGGIPISGSASGSLANVRSGGRTPVASIFYAFALLLTILFLGHWTSQIPLSCIAGILVVVAINISEYRSFISIMRGQRSDAIVMIVTFLVTVLIDLTLALEIGMILAAFLFMRRMARIGKIDIITNSIKNKNAEDDEESTGKLEIPAGIEIYELSGPFFFGIAYRFKETLKSMSSRPKILIIRLRNVPIIDATGLHNLKETIKYMLRKNIKVVLSGVQPQIYEELEKSRIAHLVGEKNILPHISGALARVNEMLTEENE